MQHSFTAFLALLRVLCFPFRWFNWIGLFGVVLLVIGVVANIFLNAVPVILIGDSIAALYCFLILMFMPGQCLALISSKQLCLLDNIKRRLLFILIAFVTILSCLVAVLPIYTPLEGADALSILRLYCAVFSCISIIFAIFTVVCSKLNGMQGFIFVFAGVFIKMGAWLYSHDVAISVCTSLLVWIVYSRWLLRWKPERFYQNMFSVSQTDWLKNQQMQQFWLLSFVNRISGKPKSLVGSLLLGVSDGWSSQWKRSAFEVVVFLGLIFLPSLITGTSQIVQILVNNSYIYLAISVSAQLIKIYMAITTNLAKTWLFQADNRTGLLSEIERLFYPRVLVGIVPGLVVFCGVNAIFSPVSINWLAVVNIIVATLLTSGVLLYANIQIFIKKQGSVTWTAWLSLSSMSFLAANAFMGQHFLAFSPMAVAFISTLYLALTLLVAVLRRRLFDLMPSASLYKVKK